MQQDLTGGSSRGISKSLSAFFPWHRKLDLIFTPYRSHWKVCCLVLKSNFFSWVESVRNALSLLAWRSTTMNNSQLRVFEFCNWRIQMNISGLNTLRMWSWEHSHAFIVCPLIRILEICCAHAAYCRLKNRCMNQRFSHVSWHPSRKTRFLFNKGDPFCVYLLPYAKFYSG